MGRREAEQLNRTLTGYLNTIHETFQALDEEPASSLARVGWEEVTKLGDEVSKQATIVGMLWTGGKPGVKALEENMASYFNVLQGFLLLAHGSRVGAGPTLSSNIHGSVKQVVDCSFMLFKESISSYGFHDKDHKLSLPQLVGTVWEACSALKKTPATNITAIGRTMTRIAMSIKDVLREMQELKPDPSDLAIDETSNETSVEPDSSPQDTDNSSDGELGNDLSPEEMKIAHLVTGVVSETLVLLKELIRSITGLTKQRNANEDSNLVKSLERLLTYCQEIGLQVDELGACLYPPQELPAINVALQKIIARTDDMQTEVANLTGRSDSFCQAYEKLRSSSEELKHELARSGSADLVPEMQNLAVSS